MKKPFNFRPFLIASFLVIAGIIFGYLSYQISLWFISGIVLEIVGCVCYLIKEKKNKLKLISSVAFIVLIIVSFCTSFFVLSGNKPCVFSGECKVTGNVYSVKETTEYWAVVLQNAKINNKKTSYKISAVIYVSSNGKTYDEGDNISFQSSLKTVNFVNSSGEFKSFYYLNNIGYSTIVNEENVSKVSVNKSWDMVVRARVKNVLYSSFSSRNAGVVYGMIFGDKSGISESDYASFKEIGIAHIFSVSGLHISILILLFSWFLSKMKVGKKANFIVILIVCLCFCCLCRFSASVVRASIMSLCLIFAGIMRKRNDSLNALGLACSLILLFSPLSLFCVGFQLSFLAVFGILTLAPVMKRLLAKIMPEKLSSAISITFCAQLGVMIVMMNVFGTFSLLSFAVNIVLIPVFTAIYSICFVFVFASSLIPQLMFLNALPNLLVQALVNTCKFLANSQIFSLSCKPVGLIVLLLFVALMLFVGNYCVLKKKSKFIVGLTLICVMFVCSVLNVIPPKFNKNQILVYSDSYAENYALFLTSNKNEVAFVTETLSWSEYDFLSELDFNNKIGKIKTIICVNNSLSSEEEKKFTAKFSVGEIVCLQSFSEFETKEYGNFEISAYGGNLSCSVFEVSVENNNVLFVLESLSNSQIISLNTYVYETDVVFSYFPISENVNFAYDVNLNIKSDAEKTKCVINNNLFTYIF